MKAALAILLAAAAVSGCTEHVAAPRAATTAAAAIMALEGWVTDPAQAPLAGASVGVQGIDGNATTDAHGHYAFAKLPTGVPIVVVAEARQHRPLSKSVTVPADAALVLNFTLEPVPVKVPRVEVVPLKAYLGCEAALEANGDVHPADCNAVDPNAKPSLDFTVGPDTAGVVVEAAWKETTPAGKILRLTVETVGFGDADAVLDDVKGPSVLRAQVNGFQAQKYYSQGGIVRTTLAAGTNGAEEESAAAASLAFQQGIDLVVSIFYVDPPLPTYTALT